MAREEFVPDVDADRWRPGLRVKQVQGVRKVFEMSWAPDGRATWEFGAPIRDGMRHVIWRRVGTHDIFTRANLARADLNGATLLGADLTDAKLDDTILSGVIADSTTTWPSDVIRE